MRKRMSRMKKEMAVAVAAAMCISLVGCGGGSSKKVVADKKEAVETTVAETTETETTAEKLTGVNDSEMADILAGTTWAGISSTQEIQLHLLLTGTTQKTENISSQMILSYPAKETEATWKLRWTR